MSALPPSPEAAPPALLERPEDGIAVVRLHRPEATNALSLELQALLSRMFAELGADPSVRCIILTGGDTVFAAGGDIRSMAGVGAIEIHQRHTERVWAPIQHCPKPVIAAICGYAYGGGCELAMLADILIAGEGARFCQPEIRIGIMPGIGGTQRLVRAVGKAKAMRMALTGRPITAQEAWVAGLVSEIVPDAEVMATALEMARTSPMEMVIPEREIPGRMAKACASPIRIASPIPGLALSRSPVRCVAIQLAPSRISPVMARRAATMAGCLTRASMSCSNMSPMTAAGREARRTRPRSLSGACESRPERPSRRQTPIAVKGERKTGKASRAKTIRTAARVPRWRRTSVKRSMLACAGRMTLPKSAKCPDELIGKNSLIPWIAPRIRPSRIPMDMPPFVLPRPRAMMS